MIKARPINHSLKVNAGALVYCVSTKRYLFLLRNSTKYAGSWGLVGGKVEVGERVIEGLYRESFEEIGRDLRFDKTIPLETFTSDNNQFVYHTFIITVQDEFVPMLNEEHRGYCWVNLLDHPRPLHPGVWRTFTFDAILDKIKILEAVL